MKIQHLRNIKLKQRGFTLVEVLVVIGILAILLAVTLVAINPGQHFKDSRDSQRQANITAILDAIYEYQSSHNGDVPPSLSGVTTTPSPIADHAVPVVGEINLCADVVPDAIADLPIDPNPTYGIKEGATCADDDYDTGYTIAKTTADRFTVSAPHKEGATAISVTR